MFDKAYTPPKYIPRKKSGTRKPDILMPSTIPGGYAHRTREANTDYHVRLLQYKQRTHNVGDMELNRAKNQLAKDITDIKYNTHAEKKRLQGQIKDRFNLKIKQYEESIDARREKLRILLAKDEQEFYHVTIDKAQRGADKRMHTMKERAEFLREEREKQRLEVVRQKRIQQYKDRCMELRPHMAQIHLNDTKATQLQQMRENQARREAEKELDKFWYNMMNKEIEARIEREKQDLIHEDNRQRDLLETWNMQVQGKKTLKKEAERIAEEDRIEMLKLEEQLRKEKIEALEKKARDRENWKRELHEQLELQEKFMAQKRREEQALDQAIHHLAKREIEKERAAIQDTTEQAKREIRLYRNHLRELEEDRKKEEKALEKLLEEHRAAIEQKQLDAKCKYEEARRKLQEDVLKGRAEQLEYKRRAAEEKAKFEQEEQNLLQQVWETNTKLKQELTRQQMEEARKYGDDLRKQIEYNNVLKKREAEEAERQLRCALKQEEEYQQLVNAYLRGEIQTEQKHPFRVVLERKDCHCASNQNLCTEK